MPTKIWQPGEAVLSSDFNPMVQEQVVATFASAAARDAAMPAPKLGAHCYLTDTKALLQYTDASGTPGWHRPWSEPWGFLKNVIVPDMHFGGWTGISGSDHYFATRGRLLRVQFNCNIYKDADGGDAHAIIRMNVQQGAAWTPFYDGLVTIHQGWVGRMICTEILDTNAFTGVWFHAMATYGTAWTQWSRITIEDMGPVGGPYTP